ncbi:chemotaxis protein CheW [Tuwongella immobilis]|nr:chemotaxis protein CheW [Tuwongella immobilis]
MIRMLVNSFVPVKPSAMMQKRVLVGESAAFEYTYRLENGTGEPFTQLRIVHELPANVRLISASVPGKIDQRQITWSWGTLAPADSVEVRVVVDPGANPVPPEAIRFWVHRAEPTPRLESQLEIRWMGPLQSGVGESNPGTLRVWNRGCGSADSVTLTVQDPKHSSEFTIDLGRLSAGEARHVHLPLPTKLPGDYPLAIRCHVNDQFVWGETLPFAVVAPQLVLEWEGEAAFRVGESFRTVLTIRNDGKATAIGSWVRLMLPDAVRLVESPPEWNRTNSAPQSFLHRMGDLCPNESRRFRLEFQACELGDVRLQAVAASERTDVQAANWMGRAMLNPPDGRISSSLLQSLTTPPQANATPQRVRRTIPTTGDAYLQFRFGGMLLAIPMTHFLAVVVNPDFSPGTVSRPGLLGITHWRGEVVSVVDLAWALGMESVGEGVESPRWLLASIGGVPQAWPIDRTQGIVRIEAETIRPLADWVDSPINSRTRGIAEVQGQRVILLDPQQIRLVTMDPSEFPQPIADA